MLFSVLGWADAKLRRKVLGENGVVVKATAYSDFGNSLICMNKLLLCDRQTSAFDIITNCYTEMLLENSADIIFAQVSCS